MKRSMWLVDLALACSPRAFRTSYREEIYDHVREEMTNPGQVLGVALSVAQAGIAMRIDNAGRAFVYALRALARSPLYTFVALGAIAVAIGANAAVSGVVEGVLLRPLPYPDQQQLVRVRYDTANGQDNPSYPEVEDIAKQTQTFAIVGARANHQAVLTGFGDPVAVSGRDISENYFAVFGAHALVGRLPDARDLGTRRIAISSSLARRLAGAPQNALGLFLTLDGTRYQVIGVTTADFRDPTSAGLATGGFWMPVDARHESRGRHGFYVVGRLRSGVTATSATADLERIVVGMVRAHPDDFDPNTHAFVHSLFDVIFGSVRPMLVLLYLTVTLVMLIACANVANLSLSRAARRERELNVRAALGASRFQLVGQLFTESLVLGLVGGAIGTALAAFALRAFGTFGSAMLPRWDAVGIDGRVLAYVALLIGVVTVLTGVLPALFDRRNLVTGLKGGRSDERRSTKRLRTVLVGAEVALALALLLSSGLILRSFVALTTVNPGFTAGGVRIAEFALPRARYDGRAIDAFDMALLARLHAAGLRNVALTSTMPFVADDGTDLQNPGHSQPLGEAQFDKVSPTYLSMLGIPLLRGRAFTDADTPSSEQVAIVSESLARRYFGSIDVIGKRIYPMQGVFSNMFARTIVGVVGDVHISLDAPPSDTVYAPLAQVPMSPQEIVVDDALPASRLRATIDDAIAQGDPQIVRPDVLGLDTFVDETTDPQRAGAILFAGLAFIALVLALAGIYAVTAYSVAQRTLEIGIRKAIGASTSRVLINVVGRALTTMAGGAVAGFALLAGASGLMRPLLFQTSAFDPLIMLLALLLLVACTVAAALIPASRASGVDPAIALRYE